MLSTRTVLREVKEVDEDGSTEYKLEKVFPVYAMGFSKPDPIFAVSALNSDPIWDAVREEAKLEAEKEPILSSFLYASILSHDCLERALGFVLANRLQNPTLLATQLTDIFCDVMMRDRGIQSSIRLDVQAFKDRDPSCLSYCSALLYLKGYHSLQTYRVAHALWNQGRKVLALALQSRISEVFGVDIHPAAKIGEGILLDHGTGVVIGETAVVGNRVSLMQGVTLGGTGKETGDRHPKVGQGALIGASATILGNIKIGEGAMIAAGSLVLKDVPPHSTVVGIPAKVIGYVDEQDPSLTMKHDASKEFFEHVAVGHTEGRSIGAVGNAVVTSVRTIVGKGHWVQKDATEARAWMYDWSLCSEVSMPLASRQSLIDLPPPGIWKKSFAILNRSCLCYGNVISAFVVKLMTRSYLNDIARNSHIPGGNKRCSTVQSSDLQLIIDKKIILSRNIRSRYKG